MNDHAPDRPAAPQQDLPSISRRRLGQGAAGLATALLMSPARAADATAADLTRRTLGFLNSLDTAQREAARFAWGGDTWRRWNFMGVGGFIKPGLRFEQMNATRKAAGWDLLASVLSADGLAKARRVMVLQDVKVEQGSGAGLRSGERFSIAVFGEPALTGRWGVRLEGHHLSLSFSVRDGQIAGVTPSSFSADPNIVRAGSRAGLVALQGEERLARRLAADLSGAARSRGIITERPLRNILSFAGAEKANARPVGVAAADLSSSQRDLLWELTETYAVSHLTPALAERQRARIRSGDRDALHFAWTGPNEAGRAFGYRVIGSNLVIELGSVDSEALHLHTIYHDLETVLGGA